jgi:hypothetical protein
MLGIYKTVWTVYSTICTICRDYTGNLRPYHVKFGRSRSGSEPKYSLFHNANYFLGLFLAF